MCTVSYDVWGYVAKHRNLLERGRPSFVQDTVQSSSNVSKSTSDSLDDDNLPSHRDGRHDAERCPRCLGVGVLAKRWLKKLVFGRSVNIFVRWCCEASSKPAVRAEKSVHNSCRRRKEESAPHVGARRAILLSWPERFMGKEIATFG